MMVSMENQQVSSEYAKTTLLLGAGFTKNFGGLLASEMWAEIFNHKEIQAQPEIKKLMLKNFDFEDVYYEILSRPNPDNEHNKDFEVSPTTSTKEEKFAIQNAVRSAYDNIDLSLQIIYNHSINTNNLKNVIEFITIFFGQTKKSFIFTLNQDLFFERMYLGKFDIPGIKDYMPLRYRDI